MSEMSLLEILECLSENSEDGMCNKGLCQELIMRAHSLGKKYAVNTDKPSGFTKKLEHQVLGKIDPIDALQEGTESHERWVLLEEIDRLKSMLNGIIPKPPTPP